MKNVLIFKVDDHKLAFELDHVEQVVWSALLHSTDDGSQGYCGMMNLHGNIIPVFAMHLLLGLPQRPIELSDQFIICRSNNKQGAFWVSRTKGVKAYADNELLPAKEILRSSQPSHNYINYVIKDHDNLIFVYDISKLLNSNET